MVPRDLMPIHKGFAVIPIPNPIYPISHSDSDF